jgi:hypothetical protein
MDASVTLRPHCFEAVVHSVILRDRFRSRDIAVMDDAAPGDALDGVLIFPADLLGFEHFARNPRRLHLQIIIKMDKVGTVTGC